MAIRTINFLPQVFQTPANQKFLNATIDQLVSEPKFKKVNGYIGRKLAPTFKVADNYLPEVDAGRQHYQLEPCVVVQDEEKNITFFNSYVDLLQQIQNYGGIVTNHSRLFNNEAYSFSGKVDFDKLVNFNQYYWLAGGPDPVDVFTGQVDDMMEFAVRRDEADNAYKMSGFGTIQNPDIILARGGTYEFNVSQPGAGFWIQTKPDVGGLDAAKSNLTTRDVFGVINNGMDRGTVIFKVPQINEQEFYTNMPPVAFGASTNIVYATKHKFSDIDNQALSVVAQLKTAAGIYGIDGATSVDDLNGKYVVFIDNDLSDATWEEKGIYAFDPWSSRRGLEAQPNITDAYDRGILVPHTQRAGVWRIELDDTDQGDYVVQLKFITDIPLNNKVMITSGIAYSNREFFKSDFDQILEMPSITAPLDTLYYVDGVNQRFYGRIKLVDIGTEAIDVENDIIGRKEYRSANGVTLTNGLKIRFGTYVKPSSYANNEYYVEGVGRSIRLVKVSYLITPELEYDGASIPYDNYGFSDDWFDQSLNGPYHPDYITSNRGSVDFNPWARSNRWFHIDVLNKTAEYNNTLPKFDHTLRATRPIIEFEQDLLLFNHGRYAKHEVDVLDFSVTDALNQLEGDLDQLEPTYFEIANYRDGMTVIFANDFDPTVRNKIWKVNVINVYKPRVDSYGNPVVDAIGELIYDDGKYTTDNSGHLVLDSSGNKILEYKFLRVHLTHVDNGTIEEFDSVVPKYGTVVKLTNMPTKPYLTDPKYATSSSAFAVDLDMWYRLLMSTNRGIDASMGLGDIPISGVLGVKYNSLPYEQTVGLVAGYGFWYNGSKWIASQRKTKVNEPVLFDIIDSDYVSFGNEGKYKNSSFRGTKLFSYKPGTGIADAKLGFPISYRNFSNVGDIEFQNNFDVDTFTELVGVATVTHSINIGYIPEIVARDTLLKTNMWESVTEQTKQFQIISNLCDGLTSYFEIDILPEINYILPNMAVYLNNRKLADGEYEILDVASRKAVRILTHIQKNDKVDILIFSPSTTNLGYYNVPKNLDYNALNQSFSSLTLGQFRNHLVAIANNSTRLTGQTPGFSNFRDVDMKPCGGNILQHSAPTIYSSLFLLNKDVNFIDAITLSQKEYSKFKNRFLESYSVAVDAGIRDIREAVDHILTTLNTAKNSQLPWYYSDMVPYDQNKTVIEYTVLDLEQTEYEIDKIFDDTEFSNKAILVYLNGVQLIKGRDYSFSKRRQSIEFYHTLAYDDAIVIHTYHNTDGCYIPETPTKLGLYPKFTPVVYVDNSYATPMHVLRGHDGSITPVFGDMRDDILLELEKRIYNNIKAQYNPEVFDINSIIPGRYRKTDYSRSEFNSIVSRSFLSWIGNNRIDYASNQWFSSNNPWSWTYSNMIDSSTGEYLPGYWKGVYRYYYDTDAPNLRPWEMLGLSEQPTWWVSYYGRAPYTGGNMVMWRDLELGVIRDGDRAGTYAQYARPGLTRAIPVTDTGVLKSPDQLLVARLNISEASSSFEIGDEGPVEAAWRRSSDYPFAVQSALALMKPAMYFGLLGNMKTYSKFNELGQYLMSTTNKRITPQDFLINGDKDGNAVVRSAGYLNWIVDYITNNGTDPYTSIHKYLDRLEVRLGYRAAGFTDKSFLKVLAEQSSPSSTNDSVVIPNENYIVYLHKSSSVQRLVYSAVIIEKTNSGYSVSGYNIKNPFFTIIPSEVSSNAHVIIADKASAKVFHDYQNYAMNIPYGHEFSNKQQVVDFLISYQRYLEQLGFVFEDFNVELQELKNWELSAKEFLTWTQQGWAAGNIIVVSPVGNTLKIVTANSVVDEIDNSPMGSKILDVGFNVIRTNMFTAIRNGNDFSISSLEEVSIGLVDLNMVQYEHALIFDNQTIFSDIIYKPELGNRQYRLKLIGNKTDDWAGQLNPPGFIFCNTNLKTWATGQDYRKGDIVSYKSSVYTALQPVDATEVFKFSMWKQLDTSKLSEGLLPNFAYNAKKFENMYDVDNQVTDERLNMYGNGLIGHRSRGYLTDLSINSTSQVKFYQGYIKDKGTKDSITALSTAVFNNLSGKLTFNEEWALRVGDYGATESKQFIEVQLLEDQFKHTPIAFALLHPGEIIQDVGVVGIAKDHLYRKPLTYTPHIFKNRQFDSIYENDILSAGYVHLDDIDATIFDITDYASLSSLTSKVVSGFKLWVAKDERQDWDVYRIDETSIRAIEVTDQVGTAKFSMDRPHGLVDNDIVVIKGFGVAIDGFIKVIDATVYNSSGGLMPGEFIASVADQEYLSKVSVIRGNGIMFKLNSLRKTKVTDINDYTPVHGWKSSDRVWVDKSTADGKWGVYKKGSPWEFSTGMPGRDQIDYVHFGTQVAMSTDARCMFITAPAEQGNNVKMLLQDNYGRYYENDGYVKNFKNDYIPGITVGNSLAMCNQNVVVSAESTVPTLQSKILIGTLVRDQILEQNAICDTTGIRITNVRIINQGSGYTIPPMAIPIARHYSTYIHNVGDTNDTDDISPHITDDLTIAVSFNSTTMLWEASLTHAGTGYILPPTIAIVGDGVGMEMEVDWEASGFGTDIAISSNGERIFVSSPMAYPLAIVDCFKKDSTGKFIKTQSIAATRNEQLGFSLDTNDDGSKLFIGSPNYDVSGTVDAGVVSIYSLNGNNFEIMQTIPAENLITKGKFGYSMATRNNASDLFVGAPGVFDKDYTSGVVHHYIKQQSGMYVLNQTIKKPYNSFNEAFGTSVAADNIGNSILISSHGAYTLNDSVFDIDMATQLTFDGGLTTIYDSIPNTGAVYVYDAISSPVDTKYLFTQALGDSKIKTGDDFGRSIAIQNYVAIVGSPLNEFKVITNVTSDGVVTTTEYIDAGCATLFKNETKAVGWTKVRHQEDKVDVAKIGRMYLYNQKSRSIVANLDFIDPIKGRILGTADQDIAYKTSFDPASYNKGSSSSFEIDETFHWGDEQVGQVWWNVDRVRYIDYEQDTLTYRMKHWGKLFPGSKIIVAEWVKSNKKPSEYDGQGTPLYPDDSAYSYQRVYDPATGKVYRETYYFWVTGKESVDVGLPFRSTGIAAISLLLESPQTQGVVYAAVLQDNAVAIINPTEVKLMSADDTILHIDYEVIDTTGLIHNEFELVQENSTSAVLPAKIVDRLIDSLSGANRQVNTQTGGFESGFMVPDHTLNEAEKYGISIRPRQTMIVNRLNAVRNLVEYVNYVFAKYPIADEFDISNLYTSEMAPGTWSSIGGNISVTNLTERSYLNLANLIVGQRILVTNDETFFGQWAIYEIAIVDGNKEFIVKQTQSFKTTDYWDKVDWFDASYDATTKPTHTIADDREIAKLKLRTNDTIWIKDNGKGQFIVYRVDGFTANAAAKADSAFLEIVKVYPSMAAFTEDASPMGIAVGQFAMIDDNRYAGTDTGKIYRFDTTGWTFVYKITPKTSSIDGVTGLANTRGQGARYFEIAKSYTSIDALLTDTNPKGIEEGQLALINTVDKNNADHGVIYMWAWNEVARAYLYERVTNLTNTLGFQVKQWQSIELPNSNVMLSLVGVGNGTIKLRDSLWAHDTNQIGFDNDSFDTVKYDLNPTIELRVIIETIKNDIFINSLDGEFNKLFFMLLNYIMSEQRFVDWAVKTSFISILHKLRKLDQFPNYIRDNQSYYEEYINEVKPYRTKIREYLINYDGLDVGQIAATDFDLPSYYDADFMTWRSPNGEHARDDLIISSNSRYTDWLNNHTYEIDYVEIDYAGKNYTTDEAASITISGGGLPDGSPYHATLKAVVDIGSTKVYKVMVLDPGSGYTSTPKITITAASVKDELTGNVIDTTARVYPKLRNSTIRSFDSTVKFDRVSHTSTVKQWAKETAYSSGDIVSYMNKAYTVINDIASSGQYFMPAAYNVIDDSTLTAADRVMAMYAPTSVMLPKDLKQLFTGTEYPGNLVDGSNLIDDPLIDTNIQSSFNDMLLGSRPEDINIDGSKFIDTFSSHAPEELIPGIMYDTLEIRVFTIEAHPYDRQETLNRAKDPTTPVMGYRVFKPMGDTIITSFDKPPPHTFSNVASTFDDGNTTFDGNATWQFKRITERNTTVLKRPLLIGDTEIFVYDVTKLPIPSPVLGIPGVVYINGERITYFTVNLAANSLGQIRRGTWGTGVPMIHELETPAGYQELLPTSLPGEVRKIHSVPTIVSDGCSDHDIPNPLRTTWLRPGVGTVVYPNNGLFEAYNGGYTEQASFIGASMSYWPGPPMESVGSLDPHANQTRYDQGRYTDLDNSSPPEIVYNGLPAQYDPRLMSPSTPDHGYDEDPLDSYDAG